MARIESLERRQIEAIAADIERQLGDAADIPGVSSLTIRLDCVDDVERWRKAVRLVGRRHGWQVRTGVGRGVAWAVDMREPGLEVRRAMEAHARSVTERQDELMAEAGRPKLRPV